MGTGSVRAGSLRVFRFADGACPLFRTVTAKHRGKGGQAPRGPGVPRVSADICSEPAPIFHYLFAV